MKAQLKILNTRILSSTRVFIVYESGWLEELGLASSFLLRSGTFVAENR